MTDFDGVHAIVVTQIDHLGHYTGIVVAHVCAYRPGWLIFHRFHVQTGVGPILDFHFFLAGHRASMAGGVIDQQVFLDIFAADFLGIFAEGGKHAVFGGQAANAVGDVH